MLNKSDAMRALEEGKTLVGSPTSDYPGEVFEYDPRKDPAGTSNPDFYPWRVVGRPDYNRVHVSQLVIKE